jgi:hypothetical protein
MEINATPWASEVMAQSYERRRFTLGLVVHAAGRASLGKPVAAPPPPPESLRPIMRQGRARFRLRRPGASSIAVVGSWDDWSSPGVAMKPAKEPGLWEAWVALPPGSHRYRFMVDGRAVRPPDAPAYLKDDFDGEDAVIDVPQRSPSP